MTYRKISTCKFALLMLMEREMSVVTLKATIKDQEMGFPEIPSHIRVVSLYPKCQSERKMENKKNA